MVARETGRAHACPQAFVREQPHDRLRHLGVMARRHEQPGFPVRDHFGNAAGGSRYAALTQITPANVGNLVPVWSYHVGPAPAGASATLMIRGSSIPEP